MRGAECNPNTLLRALQGTSTNRGRTEVIGIWDATLSEVAASQVMKGLWAKYVKQNPYTKGIALEEACATAKTIMSSIGWDDSVYASTLPQPGYKVTADDA